MRFSVLESVVGAAALLFMAAAPAHAEWRRAESEHFIVYGDTSEAALRRYTEKVERFDSLLRRYYPIPIDYEVPKLEIFLAEGLGDLRRASPGLSRSIGGFYSPNSGRIFAVVDTESPMGDAVLFHEYGHHFMFQMTEAAYPSWFVEGFAEYYATADVTPGRLKVGQFDAGRMLSLTRPSNSWPPLEDVLRWRVSESGRFRGADYYALSWALTHYFLSDPARTQQLGRYLAAVANGADPADAVRDATGRTPAQLQDDVRRYLNGRITVLSPQIELPAAEVQVTTMPQSAAQLIWYDLRLDRYDLDNAEERDPDDADEDVREAQERRARLLRDSLEAAQRFPGDRMALLVAARAQQLSGDPSAALSTLEPLLGEDVSDASALRIAATAILSLARREDQTANRPAYIRQARDYLARALDADPLDFRIYLTMDDLRRGQAGYPTANDESTLEIATTLAPQSFEARMRYASVLMAHGKPSMAIRMLTPVANSPHDGAGRKAARALLQQLRQATGAAQPDNDAPPPEEPEDEE